MEITGSRFDEWMAEQDIMQRDRVRPTLVEACCLIDEARAQGIDSYNLPVNSLVELFDPISVGLFYTVWNQYTPRMMSCSLFNDYNHSICFAFDVENFSYKDELLRRAQSSVKIALNSQHVRIEVPRTRWRPRMLEKVHLYQDLNGTLAESLEIRANLASLLIKDATKPEVLRSATLPH